MASTRRSEVFDLPIPSDGVDMRPGALSLPDVVTRQWFGEALSSVGFRPQPILPHGTASRVTLRVSGRHNIGQLWDGLRYVVGVGCGEVVGLALEHDDAVAHDRVIVEVRPA